MNRGRRRQAVDPQAGVLERRGAAALIAAGGQFVALGQKPLVVRPGGRQRKRPPISGHAGVGCRLSAAHDQPGRLIDTDVRRQQLGVGGRDRAIVRRRRDQPLSIDPRPQLAWGLCSPISLNRDHNSPTAAE